jgi:predicted O-linked N-acetylglucosamine transferase (SPINDLY family)
MLGDPHHRQRAASLDREQMPCTGDDRSPAALLNLAIAEDHGGDRNRGRQLMLALSSRLPHWDEPPLRLAESLRREGRVRDAEQAYAAVLEINPRREEALIARAALLIQGGDGEHARGLLLRAVSINPDRAEAWDALALANLLIGDADTAETMFAEARRLAPAVVSYALHRVEAAHVADRIDAELRRLERVTADDPLDPVALAAFGLALERLGRSAEAIDALEAACTLAPDAVAPAAMLGRLLARAGRLEEAETVLRRACALNAENAALGNDHAAVLMRLQSHAAARAKLEEAIKLVPDDTSVLCNMATVLVSLGEQKLGENTARRAIALDPSSSLARRTLVNALPYRNGIGGAEILVAARECAERLPRAAQPPFTNSAEPARRLRVGLLSGSLRTHPVGWLTVAGLEALDPEGFELIALAQTSSNDAIARRFKIVAREWHATDSLDDPGLAALARTLAIDVLIDLGGYGESGRMAACAYRLAPVQVKWVGMQTHSTGMPEMDWFLSDRWETPVELEHLYSERILRLPDGYVCYSPPPYAPDVDPLPVAANGFVSFGCFNNLAKVTPEVIATWAEILKRVPASIIVLKTYQFSETQTAGRIREAFERFGIDRRRVELRGSSRHRQFLAEYNQIDLVLDPFPYSGGLTTCEALWMGVPTVTLPGETFASRHSMSHLSNAGLADWVATDRDHYVELAIAKATDLVTLATLRSGLRQRVKESPLCDARRFGANLGSALRAAWGAWCTESLPIKPGLP